MADANSGLQRRRLGLQLRLAKPQLLRAARHAHDRADRFCGARVGRSASKYLPTTITWRWRAAVAISFLSDLKRTVETDGRVCFSYSPLDNTRIFNASLFAAETLASVGALTGETEFCDLALRAARYVVRRQREDGSWAYGAGAGSAVDRQFPHCLRVAFACENCEVLRRLRDEI